MEITPEAIQTMETIESAADIFYTPADLSQVINIVCNNFFIIIAVIIGTYPIIYLFSRLLRYCERAFDTEAIRKMEGGGIWNKLPDGSIYTGLEKIASVRVFDRLVRRR